MQLIKKITITAIILLSMQLSFAQMVGTPYVVPGNILLTGTITSPQTVCFDSVPAQLTSVTRGGTGYYTYQWQNSANGSSGWTNISGATGAVYMPPALTANEYYRQVITSGNQTVNSNSVEISVVSPLSTPAITITGPCKDNNTLLFAGGTATMTAKVTPVSGVSYSWIVPPELTVKGSTTGDSIVFSAAAPTSANPPASTDYTISVQATNNACPPVTANTTVTAEILPTSAAYAKIVAQQQYGTTDAAHGLWVVWIGHDGLTRYDIWASPAVMTVDRISCETTDSGHNYVPVLSNSSGAVQLKQNIYYMRIIDGGNAAGVCMPSPGTYSVSQNGNGADFYYFYVTSTTPCYNSSHTTGLYLNTVNSDIW